MGLLDFLQRRPRPRDPAVIEQAQRSDAVLERAKRTSDKVLDDFSRFEQDVREAKGRRRV